MSGEVGECAAALLAEHLDELRRIVFEPGNDLAAIAAGGAEARLVRLQHDRVLAALGEPDRGVQPRVAGADDRRVRQRDRSTTGGWSIGGAALRSQPARCGVTTALCMRRAPAHFD